MARETIILDNRWALGDGVLLTGLARDIHKAYPDKFQIQACGSYSCLWKNNPWCQFTKEPKGRKVQLDYSKGFKAVENTGAKIHFLAWFHRDFNRLMKAKVPVTLPKGDLHLSAIERTPMYDFPYWVAIAGGKLDMTVKVWAPASWQRTIDMLAERGIRIVQAGTNADRHFHPQLRNCVSAVDHTNERQLMSLIYGAQGVICGITAAMHIAACFDKPCVVIAGGRESPVWEAYTNCWHPEAWGPECAPVTVEHTYLHTIGLLDCCFDRGCWKDRTVALDRLDRTDKDRRKQLCRRALPTTPPVPECMSLIRPEHVVEAVMNYHVKGILPPVGAVPNLAVGGSIYTAADRPAAEPIVTRFPKALPEVPQEDPAHSLLDHPYIGGKITVFALVFGDYFELAKRCINSILAKSPPGRIELRVAANQPCRQTLDFLHGLSKDELAHFSVDDGKRRKYDAMRHMFYDPHHPIATKYLCWFDDDSHVLDSQWLVRLARAIADNHEHGCRLYGPKYMHDLKPYQQRGGDPLGWFKAAPWWKNRHLYVNKGERSAPNGSKIVFASGGFWALDVATMRAAMIPDARLVHNGGDVTIGAQVQQIGGKLKDFTPDKKIVCWSDAGRRGFQEDFPWSKR